MPVFDFLAPFKIHPGILLATDLNNVVETKGEGESDGVAPTTQRRERERGRESVGNPKLWKSRERKRREMVRERKRVSGIPGRPSPPRDIKVIRSDLESPTHRSYEAVLGPSTRRYLEDTRFNLEPRFTAAITRVERGPVFNNVLTPAHLFPFFSLPFSSVYTRRRGKTRKKIRGRLPPSLRPTLSSLFCDLLILEKPTTSREPSGPLAKLSRATELRS